MDAFYSILVLFEQHVTREKTHKLVIDILSGFVNNTYSVASKHPLPIIFEYEDGLYHNDYHYNDGDNEYNSDTWFSVFFFSYEMDEKIHCMTLSPSNHPGVDFIISNANLLVKHINENHSNIQNIIYSIDSPKRGNELAEIIRNGEDIKPEYNIEIIS